MGEAQCILHDVLVNPNVRKPGTPHVYHYLVEAMVKVGMLDDAQDYLKAYWGGMLESGADNFWEAYVPEDEYFSPYDGWMVNSLCHAWSCTPAYFIRRYFNDEMVKFDE